MAIVSSQETSERQWETSGGEIFIPTRVAL